MGQATPVLNQSESTPGLGQRGLDLVEPRLMPEVPSGGAPDYFGIHSEDRESPSLFSASGSGYSPQHKGDSGEFSGEAGSSGGDTTQDFGEGGVARSGVGLTPFECHSCNREYKTADAYQAHLNSHQKVVSPSLLLFSVSLSLFVSFSPSV